MFREEAVWIENVLSLIKPLKENNTVYNLGSSTAYFREVIQPHINQHIILPLKQSNWSVTNVDLKNEDGVDVVADVTKQDFSNSIQKAALTICTNMLEHVEDIQLVVKNLKRVTLKGGYILLTVPYKYRKHLDPIDNMFRPTPDEIVNLFDKGTVEVVQKKVVVIYDKEYYRIRKSAFPLWGRRDIIGYYLGKKHKVSGVLIKIL